MPEFVYILSDKSGAYFKISGGIPLLCQDMKDATIFHDMKSAYSMFVELEPMNKGLDIKKISKEEFSDYVKSTLTISVDYSDGSPTVRLA